MVLANTTTEIISFCTSSMAKCSFPARTRATGRAIFCEKAMKEIPLTQGKVALVDDKDFEKLNKHKWCLTKQGNVFYAKRCTTRPVNKTIYMHREIMGFPLGLGIDHKDTDGLNNQKSNLRICAHSGNGCNRPKTKTNTSGYKGVYYFKRDNNFQAKIMLNKKSVHIGYFNNAREAAVAYDAVAAILHGEFARLNFPEPLRFIPTSEPPLSEFEKRYPRGASK